MKYNAINNNKMNKLCCNIDNTADEIFDYLSKINDLLEMLPIDMKNAETVRICETIKNNQIVLLRRYCSKMICISDVLKNVNLAYLKVDEKFSSKKIV